MGVRRAVELAMDAPREQEGPICSFGPLIHNTQVLELLEEKGVCTLEGIPDEGNGTVLIRAHGVPPQTKSQLKAAGYRVVDATCPRVIKVQTIIRKHAKQDFACIIVGDRDHPEVTGLLGYAGQKGFVVGSMEEVEALPDFDNAIIVAQTTQNTRFYESVKRWATANHPHYKIFNTICDSTERRQAEVKRLADTVDAVIVVGGRNSGNTQRLVQIARKAGKPAYHIETEKDLEELDLAFIRKSRHVGITAGASTPNWIIKRVYRALETLAFKKTQGWRKSVYLLQRSLLLTNVYVSIGAGCLCYTCMKLQGLQQYLPYFIIAILYVQSMHILNHLTGKKSDRYNDPERANFYVRHERSLTILAVLAGAAGLLTAYTRGLLPFLILFVMSALGLSYNLQIIPKQLTGGRYRRIRDIPGSKTYLISLAWGIVAAVFPALSVTGSLSITTVFVFSWCTAMVFVRTAIFDTLDMQGDRIVGKETIPILLGEKRTLVLLKKILAAALALLAVTSAFRIIPPLGAALVICPLFMFLVLKAYENRIMVPGIRMEFLVETLFILAGAITWLWSVLGANSTQPL